MAGRSEELLPGVQRRQAGWEAEQEAVDGYDNIFVKSFTTILYILWGLGAE